MDSPCPDAFTGSAVVLVAHAGSYTHHTITLTHPFIIESNRITYADFIGFGLIDSPLPICSHIVHLRLITAVPACRVVGWQAASVGMVGGRSTMKTAGASSVASVGPSSSHLTAEDPLEQICVGILDAGQGMAVEVQVAIRADFPVQPPRFTLRYLTGPRVGAVAADPLLTAT